MKIMLLFACLFIPCLYADLPLLERYASVFSQLPEWNSNHPELEPFGQGCTNQNYLLKIGAAHYFVRVGSETKKVLDLSIAKEIEAIYLASQLRLAPPFLIADADQEIIISPFIPSKPVNLRNEEQLAQAITLLKKLHASGAKLSYVATPESIIQFYLEQIEKLNIPLSDEQRRIITERPQPILADLCPCHLDLKGDNLLDDGKRLWLIDWEFAAMSDPLFDLAILAPAEDFSTDELNRALELYIPYPTPEIRFRFKQFRILANLRGALWGIILSHTSKLDRPYRRWVDEWFADLAAQIAELKDSN